MNQVKIGIQGYEIKQELNEASMTLRLVIHNPNGSCETFAEFLKKFTEFLDASGYSFKS